MLDYYRSVILSAMKRRSFLIAPKTWDIEVCTVPQCVFIIKLDLVAEKAPRISIIIIGIDFYFKREIYQKRNG